MIFENFRPVKVLTQEEVKEELYRLRQKQVLSGVGLATGGLALYRLCEAYSATVDGFAQTAASHTITRVTKEMTRPIIFPYVCTIPTWGLYIGAIGITVALIVATIINRKLYPDQTQTHHTVLEVCCILTPIVAWFLMEVFI